MRITQQSAYILHTRAWRETSLLVDVFSQDFGRVGLVARGVRGARARLSRSLLEPMQALRMDWTGRGELQTLVAVEPVAAPHMLRGDELLSAMYVNELLVRLVARNDPHPVLFDRYRELLDELPRSASVAWSLRCFERDLLEAIGYALQLDAAADTGEPLDSTRAYDYLPEYGAVAAGDHSDGTRVRGSALRALATGVCPDTQDMAALKRLMRNLIGQQVGPRGLQSWRVLADPLRG
ncbi:MAG TPA: DNA repair protein RecO [Rhodanobacteraceae bacterium]|nr:DNA repair protein RecO [Rhodanobacteraceae bacterium]